MRLSIPVMTCNTTAVVVSQAKTKQRFIIAVDEATLQGLKALTPELKDFDPTFRVESEDREVPKQIIELEPGEKKSVLVRLGIHNSAYGKLDAEKKKALEDLCRNSKVTVKKDEK